MGRISDTLNTINTSIRTFLMVCLAGILGSAGYVTYEAFDAERRKAAETEAALASTKVELDQANTEIERQSKEITRMETAMHLLKVDHRLAILEVLSQQEKPDSDQIVTTVRFTELSPQREPVGEPKVFSVQGEIIYLDSWVVKFDDKFVESADIARGTSLALFRRVFGENQKPTDGYLLDEVGSMPQAYLRGGEPSDFEREIWAQFWEFAADREKAAEKGIRAAHGEAPSFKAIPGQVWEVTVRASGGLSVTRLEGAEPADQ
ncbi:MAG: hypothetical protein R3C05_10690 [Pirellulaceae bacterium]